MGLIPAARLVKKSLRKKRASYQEEFRERVRPRGL
jgi:hypothetical protein